jgi:RND family efflux transporter MFP subunit
MIADYEDTTGRIEAVKTVELRARVTGYLNHINFKEGSTVKEGDVLFEIDPRPYEAQLARAAASVTQGTARLNRMRADTQRALAMRSRNAIGREEFDKIVGDRDESAAGVESSRADRDLAQLNLDFTKVRAPIAGLVSRQYIDAGNLVKADDTLLTVIVSHDKMYAYFDVDERTLLRLRRMMQDGLLPADPTEAKMPVKMGLADEEGFPHTGEINFVDNRLDATTGTLRLRARFDNPHGLLTPGLFVRIRVLIGKPHDVTLIPEEALGTDQGRKFVYVVDAEDKAQYRPIKVGKLHDGLRVITGGLKENERVVIDGLQRVRPGAPVTPKDSDQKSETRSQKTDG